MFKKNYTATSCVDLYGEAGECWFYFCAVPLPSGAVSGTNIGPRKPKFYFRDLQIDKPLSLLVTNLTLHEHYHLHNNYSFRMFNINSEIEDVLFANHSAYFRFGLIPSGVATNADFFIAASAQESWRSVASVANTMVLMFSGPFESMNTREDAPIRLVQAYLTPRFLLSVENRTAFVVLPSVFVNSSMRSRDDRVEIDEIRTIGNGENLNKRVVSASDPHRLDYTIVRVMSTGAQHLKRLTRLIGTPSALPHYGPQALTAADFRVVTNPSADEMDVSLYFGKTGCCVPEATDWGLAMEWKEDEPGDHAGSLYQVNMQRGMAIPLTVAIGSSRLIQQELLPYQHLVISGSSDYDNNGQPVQFLVHGAASAVFSSFFTKDTCSVLIPHDANLVLRKAYEIDKFGVEYLRAHDFCLVLYNKHTDPQHLALNISYYVTPTEPATDNVTRNIIIAIASVFGAGFLLMGIGFAYRHYARVHANRRNAALKAQLLPTGSLPDSYGMSNNAALEDSDEETWMQSQNKPKGRSPFRNSMLEEGYTDKY